MTSLITCTLLLLLGTVCMGDTNKSGDNEAVEAETGDGDSHNIEKRALGAELPLELAEVELDGPAEDKRWMDDVFETDYPYRNLVDNGNAEQLAAVGQPDKRYFGSVLGHGFSFGKREYDAEDSRPDKRRFGSILGHGFSFGKRDDDAEQEVDEKRAFGSILGHGYSFGKRDSDSEYEIAKKRRFGNILGHGFSFGKRDYDLEDETPEKRHFGSILGHGFSFGKRDYDLEDETPEKRHFGSILGHGFSFGKREGDENELPEKRKFGSILGHGFSFGKREGGEPELPEKRHFGSILGHGFSFGKRENYANNAFDDGFIPDKRYGYMLGSGLAFGKRDSEGMHESQNDKRSFGYIMGHGYTGFGKRTSDDEEFNAGGPDKRSLGYVIGRGFAFGKRDGSEAADDFQKRQYGYVLGRGFSFGKRNDDSSYGTPDKRHFGYVLGRGFSFGKRDDSHSNENDDHKRYFNSDFGGRFDWSKRDIDDYQVENNESPDSDESIDKRAIGSVLGRGYMFGKRGNDQTNELEEEMRFSHNLGQIFGLRHPLYNQMWLKKRMPEIMNPPIDEAVYEDDDYSKRFSKWLHNRYMFGNPHLKRYGHLLGNGFALGKRSHTYDDAYDIGQSPDKRGYPFIMRSTYKRYGHILGGGFAFGKRNGEDVGLYIPISDDNIVDTERTFDNDSNEDVLGNEKRSFGNILGGGFRLGKRRVEYTDDQQLSMAADDKGK